MRERRSDGERERERAMGREKERALMYDTVTCCVCSVFM